MKSKTRREFLKAAGAAAATVGVLPAAAERMAPPQERNMPRPNILYLHTHDLGRYCQPYGYPVPTPNMQRLAEEGVVFRQAFNGGPTCSPARAALLTGQWNHNNGMLGLAHLGFRLNDYRHHIIHTLREHGYRSALAGVQHIASHDHTVDIGYDEHVPMPEGQPHRTATVAAAAADWIANAPKEPFFLSAGFGVTHRPHIPYDAEQEDPRYCRPPAPIPDTPETRADMATFKAAARRLDEAYGTILDALDQAGLAENTLVICTTDHGIAFPAMKCNLTDHGIGVALILRGPGGFTGGKVIDGMVSQIDIFPTVCEILGIGEPEWLQGKSMMPLLRGEQEEIHEEVFSEVTYHAAYEPKRAVRTKRWKYIRRYDGRTTTVLPNCDASPSKDLWLENGWQDRPIPEEQLYDLIFDPTEVANLAYDPHYENVLKEMRGRLERWMRETNDPILEGLPVVAPEGAVANDVNDIHPGKKSMRPIEELRAARGK